MLRIITQRMEAESELRRISNRMFDDQVFHKEATVTEVLQAVRRQGDEAVVRYTTEFDQVDLTPSEFRVSGAELDAAFQQVKGDLLRAIELAHSRIVEFHQKQLPQSWVSFDDQRDVVLGKRYTPVDAAGIYVPGGKASYPSTVLMNAVPAIVAGVKRVVMVTPPGREKMLNPAILVAAQVAGVEEIYRVGGAQAIAALAFGTTTIPPVNIITGPGNIYVTLAKKQVFGHVGIDSLAGPSEVLVIADETAHPRFVAADLLAQAEHDSLAAAILITTSSRLAQEVNEEVMRQIEHHPRRILTEKAIANYGASIIVANLTEAADLSNQFAPEHLQLEIEEPWELLSQIRHAGAIFCGHFTPEAVGDYLAGPNHTLPTSGAARYASPLSTETFMKHSSIVQYGAAALAEVSEAIALLTDAEGLPSHGNSVRLRQQP
ncbi:MAG: histidinol dehydrogenase [Oscillatoriales cyanobacterium SM2_2_1]|nr:histidinol dehydrogenase [Oscillatoriales cyanobacterium SM2_2_1]